MQANCQCESNYTCGHCLRNAKPWHFTGFEQERARVFRAHLVQRARKRAAEGGDEA